MASTNRFTFTFQRTVKYKKMSYRIKRILKDTFCLLMIGEFSFDVMTGYVSIFLKMIILIITYF